MMAIVEHCLFHTMFHKCGVGHCTTRFLYRPCTNCLVVTQGRYTGGGGIVVGMCRCRLRTTMHWSTCRVRLNFHRHFIHWNSILFNSTDCTHLLHEPSFKCGWIFRNTRSITMHTYTKVVWHIFSSFTSYKSVTWHQSTTTRSPAVAWTGVCGVRDSSRRNLARFQRRISLPVHEWHCHILNFIITRRVPLGTSRKQNKYFHLCSDTLGSRAEAPGRLRVANSAGEARVHFLSPLTEAATASWDTATDSNFFLSIARRVVHETPADESELPSLLS